jgi:hypothetical protein
VNKTLEEPEIQARTLNRNLTAVGKRSRPLESVQRGQVQLKNILATNWPE